LMAVSYTCPNPDCGAAIKTPNRVQPGKSVKCPKCNQPFVPEPEEKQDTGPGVFKLVDEQPKKPAGPAKPGGKKAEPPKPEPPKPGPASNDSPAKRAAMAMEDDEDEESIKKGYGVVKETEEELKEAEKHKPKFTDVRDKFKKSARGPAQALLVMPSQLLTFEGLITLAGGVLIFIVGMWPLVFNDAPPGDEEAEEAFQQMAIGIFAFVWGSLICFGASEMHEIRSYTWSMVGSVLGVLPLLVGIFGIVMLQNPKVKAGFEEGEAGPDEDEDEDEDGDKEGDEDDDDDDDDDDGAADDDDDDDDEKPKTKKRKVVRRQDDDDEEDERPKKKRKRPMKMDDD
jgi:hypothetical protein